MPMQLHEYAMAPNPRIVRIYLAEKGINVPKVTVDIAKSENRQPEYLAKNPMGGVPMLELEDGTYVAETIAICRYFEEQQPEPPLFGVDAKDKAVVEMWRRRMELEVATPIMQTFRNTHDFFKGRITQVAEWGEVMREAANKRLAWLDSVLADREWIAGDRYTIADITAMVGIDFGRPSKIRIADDQKNLTRWHEAASARPSAKA